MRIVSVIEMMRTVADIVVVEGIKVIDCCVETQILVVFTWIHIVIVIILQIVMIVIILMHLLPKQRRLMSILIVRAVRMIKTMHVSIIAVTIVVRPWQCLHLLDSFMRGINELWLGMCHRQLVLSRLCCTAQLRLQNSWVTRCNIRWDREFFLWTDSPCWAELLMEL